MKRAFVVVVGLCNALLAGACSNDTPVQLWVDGFAPDNVRFEVEPLGPQTADELAAIKKRPDVDGALLLPEGSCGGPCRAAIVSVFVTNRGANPEPPPVVRLDVPAGKPRRLPIAFRDHQIERGAIGRIRWLVEMWPDERELSATLSSSVAFEVTTTTPTTTTPTTTTPTTTTPTTTTPTTTTPTTTTPTTTQR
jgi:hypothetical protein